MVPRRPRSVDDIERKQFKFGKHYASHDEVKIPTLPSYHMIPSAYVPVDTVNLFCLNVPGAGPRVTVLYDTVHWHCTVKK